MNRKKIIRKYLYEAKKDKIRNPSHESVTFYIKTGKGKRLKEHFRLDCIDDFKKVMVLLKLMNLCREVRAKEVVSIADSYIFEDMDIPKPEEKGLLLSFENHVGIESVTLPYRLSADGQIIFGRELWEFRNKKDLPADLGWLVQ